MRKNRRAYDQSLKNIPQDVIDARADKTTLENAAGDNGLNSNNAKLLPPIARDMSQTIPVASVANTITVLATIEPLIALTANAKRSSLIVSNRSTTNEIYVTFGQKPNRNLQDAIPIPPGGNLFYDRHCPTNDILVTSSTGATNVTIVEGVYI